MQPHTVISTADHAVFRKLRDDEGAVVLHLQTAAYHRLNPMGSAIWEAIGGTTTFSTLVERVTGLVDDPPSHLPGDTEDFLRRMADLDLIEIDEPDQVP